jgi:hypothetical protein
MSGYLRIPSWPSRFRGLVSFEVSFRDYGSAGQPQAETSDDETQNGIASG